MKLMLLASVCVLLFNVSLDEAKLMMDSQEVNVLKKEKVDKVVVTNKKVNKNGVDYEEVTKEDINTGWEKFGNDMKIILYKNITALAKMAQFDTLHPVNSCFIKMLCIDLAAV